jgi:hypothetical protein
LDDVNPLFRYWKDNPPAHVILAAVHTKPKKKRGIPEEHSGSTEQELLQSGVMTINRKATNV